SRAIGMDGSEGTIVASIHGLQHIQRFFSTHLADDDSVGTHPQAVDDELALLDGPGTLDVSGTAFQSNHVTLLELQLRRIFYGHDSFIVGNVSRKHVQHGGFSGTSSSGDHNVQ